MPFEAPSTGPDDDRRFSVCPLVFASCINCLFEGDFMLPGPKLGTS